MKSTDTVAAPAAVNSPAPSVKALIFAVLWSFFGIRKMANLSQDMRSLKPQWLILTAVAAAAGFISILLTLVRVAIHILSASA
ncbi:DUF2970 domain-containing protein [Undibacterium sp. TJN25]|uniref:DUF2970 domain-containing protein n=1 Tax=Undibacterium sp. TJN25 TaxID=3413056 RepID=UPI003BEF65AF